MSDKIDTSAEAIAAIREKVRLFQRLGLPGQGMGMHMGTFYLVNDLDGLTKALAAERDRLAAENARLRMRLQSIVDSYEASSELHTSAADCAANLYDRILAALKGDSHD